MEMKPTEEKLINEIEKLIKHAEDDTLDYSVLEHARKVVFQWKEGVKKNGPVVIPNNNDYRTY